MDLCDASNVKRILQKYGFSFSKALGQNFIIDRTVCPKMAESLCADEKTGVIEVGAGIGVLTKELCRAAHRVVCVELDSRLIPLLGETLDGCENLEIVNADIMETDLCKLISEKLSDCSSVKVCANLPYYITSPVIMSLLEGDAELDEIVVMVQKEAGERLCAQVGTRQSGAVTVAVSYYAESEILFNVSRDSFMPSPKVDSVVIRLTPKKERDIEIKDEKRFFRVVKCAFSQRRKTALNSISNTMGVSKETVSEIFEGLGIEQNIRAEGLTMKNFADIAEMI